ncbi:MAG TPA: AAA family ATPase [Candidatus Angelobacter sp.]
MPQNLVGASEVAELLNVSKQTLVNWRAKGDFPEPVADLKSGPVWDQGDVLRWAQQKDIKTLPKATQSRAQVVAVTNMKGGVGKSTLTANFGWYCAAVGKRVLLVDLDPQFNLSQYVLGVSRYEKLVKADSPTILDIFEQVGISAISTVAPKRESTAAIVKVASWATSSKGALDLVPSRLELAWTLKNPQFKEKPLAKFVKKVSPDYDLILIDCPPTESILTEAAYLASDWVLVPVKPEFLSAIGLHLLGRSLREFKERNEDSKIEVGGIVFNLTYPDKPEHQLSKKEVLRTAKENGWKVFENQVSYSDSYPRGSRLGRPIFRTNYARWEKVTEFKSVAREFMDAIGLQQTS